MQKNIFRKSAALFFLLYFVFSPLAFFDWTFNLVLADDSTASVTVGNSAPAASSVSLNGGNAITLTENTTASTTVTAVITDNNSCQDLTSVKVAVYKQGTTCAASGDADNDDCYFWEDTSPSTDSSCTGTTDTTYALSHDFAIQYYADGGTWLATVTPADEGAGQADNSTTVTLNNLQSLNVSATISFGSVSAGASSIGDNTATVTNTGNVAVDFKVSGTALTCTTRGSIDVGNQEYSLASFNYGSGTDLTGTGVDVDAVLPAPSAGTVPVTDLTYWQVGVPSGVEGTCSGTTSFVVEAALP